MKSEIAGALVAACFLTFSNAALEAQRPGTIELGAFGTAEWLDPQFGLSHVPPLGISARVGVFVLPNVQIEASGGFARTNLLVNEQSVDLVPLRGRLVWTYPGDLVGLQLGAGAVHNRYRQAVSGSESGVTALVGFRARYTERTSLRTGLTWDYVPSPQLPVNGPSQQHWAWEFGLAWQFGGGSGGVRSAGEANRPEPALAPPPEETRPEPRPRPALPAERRVDPNADDDGDGVANSRDRCSDTDDGLAVDRDGCPRDADGDGVPDSLDRCPGTVRGVPIDDDGCARDADRDGVPDARDRCSNTPGGTEVGADGCPRPAQAAQPEPPAAEPPSPQPVSDADNDGVPDSRDRCAGTPAGARVDATGCPTDADGDGVADGVDRCPDTAAGVTPDATGCPMDSDGDGVLDGLDECPGTAPGVEIEVNGCRVLFVEEAVSVVLDGVTFATSSAELTPEAQTTLDRVASSLNANPDVQVEVQGHTDSTGPRAFNTTLSQSRAESVVAYLVARGVAASRLTARGYGPDQPVASNDTAAGRQGNRRVELRRTN